MNKQSATSMGMALVTLSLAVNPGISVRAACQNAAALLGINAETLRSKVGKAAA